MDWGNKDSDNKVAQTELLNLKTHAVLYVDDEGLSLKQFAGAFGNEFRILTAATAREGAGLLNRHQGEIGVLMTDQNMPGEKGVWLLHQAQMIDPLVVRILATASCDWKAILEAMEIGLFSFIPLPWEPEQLPWVLRRALHLYQLQRELLRRHTTGDLNSGDYLERLNALRGCFGDGHTATKPGELKSFISGEGDKTLILPPESFAK
jgi:DNA-binding NtrC family response regulator